MKSRPLIITFSAVLLSLFLTSAICAQTKSNTWIKETWEGTGYQIAKSYLSCPRIQAGLRR